MRPIEVTLIRAVNQLCDGMPSEETGQLMISLERPLDIPAQQITRLFGTHFDARYVNQVMLEEIDEEMLVFRAEDEGIFVWLYLTVSNTDKLLVVCL